MTVIVPEGSLDDLRRSTRDKIIEARHRFGWCREDVNITLIQLGLPRVAEDWTGTKPVAAEGQAKIEFVAAVHNAGHRIASRRTNVAEDAYMRLNTLFDELGIGRLM